MSDLTTGPLGTADINLWGPVLRHAETNPTGMAISFESEDRLTYGELAQWMQNSADLLAKLGVEPGDRVSIVGPNSLEWVAAAFGAWVAGAVLAPMNFRWVPSELAVARDVCQPRLIITDAECMANVAAAFPSSSIVALSEFAALRSTGTDSAIPRANPAPTPDAPALIIFTSGSTSKPNAVVFTPRQILTSIFEWSLLESGFRGPQRLLLMLPLAGSAGILRGILYPLTAGGTVFLERRVEPARALRLVERERITVLNSVPYVFERIAEDPSFPEADLSSLIITTVGGAPVTRRLQEAWRNHGIALRQIWGMTEGGGACSINTEDLAKAKPELCGSGGIWTRIRTVREDGVVCDPGEIGEIQLAGPGVCTGYWRPDGIDRSDFVDGWFRTGDLGVIDYKGNLEYVGRQKDMIISGGINIASREIEAALLENNSVIEAVVFGIPDERFGECVGAVVYALDDLEEETVRIHCRELLADFKVPRRLVITREPLPRLASGKVAKQQIRVSVVAGDASGPIIPRQQH